MKMVRTREKTDKAEMGTEEIGGLRTLEDITEGPPQPVPHPLEDWLRSERMPHIWCPGCGLGTAMSAFIRGIQESGIPREKVVLVSGIGCTGRIPGYIRLDAYHVLHGRAIPFAVGLKLARPDLTVVVVSGDGDIVSIGGNHFIHAARRNVNITVICVNNFNYGMTGGQSGPTTPLNSVTTTTPYGAAEHAFNLPHLAAAAGAVYVARWTTLHMHQLKRSIKEAMLKKGFSFVEILAPCPTSFGRPNNWGEGVDEMIHYRTHAVIKHGADPAEASIGLDTPIIVGKFIDIEKVTLLDTLKQVQEKAQGA
ncbi:MAG: thiamine pyrophosphate-dependent enzyme [bacterium JZ-2024 1]